MSVYRRATDLNPYRSPAESSTAEQPFRYLPAAQAIASLVGRGLLYRKIQVESPIEAVVEYRGLSLFDRVWVNQRLVSQKLPIVWLTDRFDFELPGEAEPIRVSLRLKFTRFARLIDSSLWIEGREIFRESQGRPANPLTSPGG